MAVKAINSQAAANAAAAAIKIGIVVLCDEVFASTQTISAEVFASAEWMAFAIRS